MIGVILVELGEPGEPGELDELGVGFDAAESLEILPPSQESWSVGIDAELIDVDLSDLVVEFGAGVERPSKVEY